VELIVVIVILGILAAIAVPALTGYIAKAEDEKYIVEARNRVMACRTVLDEAYADGELTSPAALSGGRNGYSNIRFVTLDDLSSDAFGGDTLEIYKRAAELQGESYPPPGVFAYSIALASEEGSGATALTADGFMHQIWHEGYDADDRLTIVTYKLSAASVPLSTRGDFFAHAGAALGTIRYDENAGYVVYHLVGDMTITV
jgi:type II secretory pathway pseudopilin PulG